MTAHTFPLRRSTDWKPADHAIQILRDTNLTQDSIASLISVIRERGLNFENFKTLVDVLALQADAWDADGWYGMDCVADGLTEASGCLIDVRGPNAEDEAETQRDLRLYMEAGAR